MNTRRSFFKRIATFAAVIALAPELAFRAKLPLDVGIDWKAIPFWMETSRISHYRSLTYVKWLSLLHEDAVNKFLSK